MFAWLLAPLAAQAAKPGKGKAKGRKPKVRAFAAPDVIVLREYVPNFPARGGDLPPGIEKRLVRTGHLPPGLEKRIVPFPVELEQRLLPLEPGYQRGFIAGRAIVFNSGTRLILDVFIP